MSATDLVLQVIALLEQLSIPYMLVGSYSSNYYGRPRSTQDADFVVVLGEDKLEALRAALGAQFRFDPQMAFEGITMTTRHVIEHPASAFKIELFLLTADPHDQSRFSRRQRVSFENQTAYLPTPEDVIIQKLRWFKAGKRAKDLEDASEIVRVQGAGLDLEYLRKWTGAHGTAELLCQLLRPPAGQA